MASITRTVIAVCLTIIAFFNIKFALTYSPVVKIELIADSAGVLSETESAYIVDYHNALMDDYGIDYRVLTTFDAANIDELASERFETLDGGSFRESGRGLLLVVHPGKDKVRLEVGAELKDTYTKSFVDFLEHTQMTPFFQEHHEGAGIVATSELIVTRAQEATKDLAFDPSSTQEPTTDTLPATPPAASQESPETPETIAPMPDVSAGGDPLETVDAYIQAMDEGNARPDLDIYSKASQDMLKDWVVTKAQMRNVVRENRRCSSARYQMQGKRAVVRYDSEPGVCNPYFLIRENGRWRIDFVDMQKLIRFDENNHWTMPWGAGDFSFAFPDLPITSPPEDRCRWCFTFRREDLVILSIDPGSIGEQMGLKVGDKILELDGERHPSMQWVFSHLYTVEQGAMVRITVLRDGKRLKLSHRAP